MIQKLFLNLQEKSHGIADLLGWALESWTESKDGSQEEIREWSSWLEQ